MSTRRDIQDGAKFEWLTSGLVYTEVLGWLDMGHARGDDIIALKRKFLAGENSGKDFYTVMYRQDMRIARFGSRLGIGKFSRWQIKRGRSGSDVNRIMLAMMLSTSFFFENLQSQRVFSWYTDSGYSGEDLVSNCLDFIVI